MAQVLRPNTTGSLFATDGKPHPLQDTPYLQHLDSVPEMRIVHL